MTKYIAPIALVIAIIGLFTGGSVAPESQIGSVSATNAGFTFNEDGTNDDTRIEGDTQTHLFFADASADRIGIASSTPTRLLSVGSNTSTSSVAFGKACWTVVGADGTSVFMWFTAGGKFATSSTDICN